MAVSILRARKRFKTRLLCGLFFKPLRLFCTSCGKYVPSDMPWRCGYCDFEHPKVKLFSFLHKCRRCKRAAKSFVCPHCEKIICLDKDQNGTHPARNIGKPLISPTERELRDRKKELQEEEKSDLIHEVEVTDLRRKIARIKQASDNQISIEGIKSRLSEREAYSLGVHMAADEKLEEYKVRFANNPLMLRRGQALVEEFVASEIGGTQ